MDTILREPCGIPIVSLYKKQISNSSAENTDDVWSQAIIVVFTVTCLFDRGRRERTQS